MSAPAAELPPATRPMVDTAVSLERYDGAAVIASLGRWIKVYEDVYAASLGLPDHSEPAIGERLSRHTERTGFTLVAAFADGRPAGFVYGYQLPADTWWWDGLEPDPGPRFTTEWPGRTFAICEGLVDWTHRGLGLAGQMYGELLAGRTEERIAVHIAHDNELMLSIATAHGGVHVGDLDPFPGWRRHAAFVLQLRPEASAAPAPTE
jgi:hypothetical protein